MTAQIRLIVLMLVLAYTASFGPSQSRAGATRRAQAQALRVSQPRPRIGRAVQPGTAADSLGVRAARFARRLVGVPYRWGGDSPATGFDCSGLVRFVYQHFGISLPHSSYGDFNLGTRVSRGALRPGDLVFFDGVGHVGMYVGNGRFIHAPHSGTNVEVTSLSEFASSYDGARRLLPSRPTRPAPGLKPRKQVNVLVIDGTWFRASYGALSRTLVRPATRLALRAGTRST
jgi:cell wall-associated NlpC family hydrolase